MKHLFFPALCCAISWGALIMGFKCRFNEEWAVFYGITAFVTAALGIYILFQHG